MSKIAQIEKLIHNRDSIKEDIERFESYVRNLKGQISAAEMELPTQEARLKYARQGLDKITRELKELDQ